MREEVRGEGVEVRVREGLREGVREGVRRGGAGVKGGEGVRRGVREEVGVRRRNESMIEMMSET